MTAPRVRRIALPEPFDLAATLRPWSLGGADPTIRIARRSVSKAAHLSSGAVAIHFEHDGREVTVSAWGPGAEEALERAPEMLGADDEPGAFAPRDAEMARLVAVFPGLRMGRAPSLMEVLINTIVQQRVTTREATRSLRVLAGRHGGEAPGPLRLTLPVPAAALARVPYYELHPIGIEKRRADILRYVAARPKRIAALTTLDRQESTRRLGSVKGIGPWTVGLVAGIALGDADAVPTGDYHLPNLVAWALAGEPRGDDARMLELLEPYAGHRWRVIRLLRLAGLSAPRFGPRKGPGHWNRNR